MTATTMLGELRRSCREWPDRPALVAGDATTTYRQLWGAIAGQAALYRALGVRPGDRVLSALPNCPEHVVAIGAAWACGAAHVAAGVGATAGDVAWLAGHVEARVVLAGRTAAEVPADWPAAIRAARPEARIATCEEAAGVAPDGEPMAEVAEEDVALIRFSSGTTGTPKGLVARHGPSARAWTNLARLIGLGPDDVHLGHLPLAFGFGLQMAMLPLLTGGRLVLVDRFRPGPARELIERHRVTVLDGVPAGFRQLLDAPGSPAQVASLRTGIGSGDAFPPALVARIVDELGMDLVLMYGAVEGFGMLTRERRLMLAGAVGRPAPGSVLIAGADGRPVPAGQPGEVAFRRHAGSPTPWGGAGVQPWYRTGDAGRLDRNGWLHLTGRLKHQINRGGLKVDPVEVAGQLLACAGVADAAVVGLADPVLGEVPCACVVPAELSRPPALDELQRQLRRVLAPYKVPAALCLLAEIPLTGNGKVDVARLRVEAGAVAPPRSAAEPGDAGAAALAAAPPVGPVTLPEVEQELARLVHDVGRLRDGLDGPDRALLGRIAAAAAEHAGRIPRTGAALPAGRFVTTEIAVATDGMRAWWADLAALVAGPAEDAPPASDPGGLAARLLALARAGGEAGELAWLLFLGCARRALVPHRHLPAGPDREPGSVALRALGDLIGASPLYVGRPAFVTDELLAALRAEAAERRSLAALDQGMLMAAPGEAARRFAYRDDMRELLWGLGLRVEASGSGKYVYCDVTATGPGEHLHEMPFVVNVELSLEHVSPGRPGAQIVLVPPFAAPRPVWTRPGDLVVWAAGSVPHARDEVAAGERLTGLSMFYEPVR